MQFLPSSRSLESLSALIRVNPRSSLSGFSLIELLVVTAVIGILVAVTAGSVVKARQAGWRSTALQNMRQVGIAIQAYADDRNGYGPGPLWPGQIPVYDPARDGRLARELAPYLGQEKPAAPKVVGLFVPPAFVRAAGAPKLEDARTYVMNMAYREGDGTAILNPWGSLADNSPRTGRLSNFPPDLWGFTDADQQHPRVAGAPWRAQTPPAPIHGARRLAWFLGGHAAPIDSSALALP
jgi:prepilin-type N-terminal cleavage/methylation domain-containing protein